MGDLLLDNFRGDLFNLEGVRVAMTGVDLAGDLKPRLRGTKFSLSPPFDKKGFLTGEAFTSGKDETTLVIVGESNLNPTPPTGSL